MVLVLAAGCSSPTTFRATPTAQPSRLPLANLDLADWDTGRAVQVFRGQGVAVRLHPLVGYAAWTTPESSDPAVLAPRVGSRGAAPAGVTLGSFQAARPGTARLQATAQPVCPPEQPCPPARRWAIAVTVLRL